ncbi:hypothetical protein H0A36_07845 [Endozoicomonas sp. SM1973]|uniref:Haemolysin-type calcium binding-related domain-containing protein n=1 Tax=Spartinivicinus marinus TaxID=2994442 RepID=A0A853I9I0_9GAMM|nr:hypothetical protein [Spartinivicinus marinus]MCX4029166.1 hypothetical protein [Spartinivicinus marinus]NYZ65925.1 hypothetical protein [Spartinivicinus marinus]
MLPYFPHGPLVSGSDRDQIIYQQGDGSDQLKGDTTGDVLNLKDISLYNVHFSIPELEFDNTLHISFKGQAGDHIAIENWNENQGFQVITDDGSVIDKQGIDQLIQSLASFDADAWASSPTPVDGQTKTAIASAWILATS